DLLVAVEVRVLAGGEVEPGDAEAEHQGDRQAHRTEDAGVPARVEGQPGPGASHVFSRPLPRSATVPRRDPSGRPGYRPPPHVSAVDPRRRAGHVQSTRPFPVTRGRSSAVSRPGFAATTAGTAFTSRMAVALSPAVLWSPSPPSICRSRV